MEINNPKTMLLRLLFALWLVQYASAVGAAFLCVVAFIVGYIPDPENFPAGKLLPVAMHAGINLPLSLLGRHLGLRYGRFREQEQLFRACLAQSRGGRRSYACQLERLVERIDASTGWERQQRRRVAQRWLTRVNQRLSQEERSFARQRLDYLMHRD